MASKITMSMIAQKAGVSQPTVSIVLNNSDAVSISLETKKRVLQAAKELGYTKKLGHKKSLNKQIALIIDGALYTNDHFIVTINAAIERAQELNINLKVFATLNTKEGERLLKESVENGEIDIAIIASNMTTNRSNCPKLNLPTVYLNCLPKDDLNVIAILPDDYANAKKLANAVFPHYKHPLVIAGDAWMKATSDRLQALKEVFDSCGANFSINDVYYSSWSFRNAHDIVLDRIKADPSYDIIFCASDYVALGVYQALSTLNKKIGEDIAVVGYDNQTLCKELYPHLTSVQLPYEAMAQIAVEYAYALSIGKQVKKEKIKTLSGDIYIRKSTQKAFDDLVKKSAFAENIIFDEKNQEILVTQK